MSSKPFKVRRSSLSATSDDFVDPTELMSAQWKPLTRKLHYIHSYDGSCTVLALEGHTQKYRCNLEKFETPNPDNLPGIDVFVSTADPEKETVSCHSKHHSVHSGS
ncbi:hypothetical protein MTR_0019s0090 [Medicago truncatula]|uniref:Uncharacterized protein n=1 Tax=Medicago truncatula TaxID=3880 RepID=A0A072TJQ7_MEDTR|nr:hypothetical protein MTR_0019s0090 [Medicago truncatula]